MKKLLTIDLAMIIGALVAVSVSAFAGFAEECEQISDNVLRLHIIAESDSVEDQQFKYELRDYILETFSPQLADCNSVEAARARSVELVHEIRAEANGFAQSRNYDREIVVDVIDMYFVTRVYESVTMPAGNYAALRITVGSGGGENWWCVMFPPLCLPAVTANDEEVETIYFADNSENDTPKIKFAIYEFFSRRFNRN
ncbi:MAG: stage II sporulation protein R [Oscillospiraceae bacterium]|nr:stage II sporulation protein R [Oscillospiraceae bacterium]